MTSAPCSRATMASAKSNSANLARFLDAIIPDGGTRHPHGHPSRRSAVLRARPAAHRFHRGDVEAILRMSDSPANGLCFCTGSLQRPRRQRPARDGRRFAPRIHAAHLRSTQLEPDGSFYEADHLAGSVDMPAVARVLLDEQDRRRTAAPTGRSRSAPTTVTP
jgi:mannonate dehydratase